MKLRKHVVSQLRDTLVVGLCLAPLALLTGNLLPLALALPVGFQRAGRHPGTTGADQRAF